MARNPSPQNKAFVKMISNYLKQENIKVPVFAARLTETRLIKYDLEILKKRIGDWNRGKSKPTEENIRAAVCLVLRAHENPAQLYREYANQYGLTDSECERLAKRYAPDTFTADRAEIWKYIFDEDNNLSPLVKREKSALLRDIHQETLRREPLVKLEATDTIGTLKFAKVLLWLRDIEYKQALLPEYERTRGSHELALVANNIGIADQLISDFVDFLLEKECTPLDVAQTIHTCLPLTPYIEGQGREAAISLRDKLLKGSLRDKLIATIKTMTWLSYEWDEEKVQTANVFLDIVIENTVQEYPLNDISLHVISKFVSHPFPKDNPYMLSDNQYEIILGLISKPDFNDMLSFQILGIFGNQFLMRDPFAKLLRENLCSEQWAHIADMNQARRHAIVPEHKLIEKSKKHEIPTEVKFALDVIGSTNFKSLKSAACLACCRMGYWTPAFASELLWKLAKVDLLYEKHELIYILARNAPSAIIPSLLLDLSDDFDTQVYNLTSSKILAIIGCGSLKHLEKLADIAAREKSPYHQSAIYAALTSEETESTFSFLKNFPWWKTRESRRLAFQALKSRNLNHFS